MKVEGEVVVLERGKKMKLELKFCLIKGGRKGV